MNPNWAATKSELPANKIVPPSHPTPQQRFTIADNRHNGNLSLQEFIGKRPEDKHEVAKKQFTRKDKDKSGSLSLAEYLPAKPAK